MTDTLKARLDSLLEHWREQAKVAFLAQPILGGPGDVYQRCAHDLAALVGAEPPAENGTAVEDLPEWEKLVDSYKADVWNPEEMLHALRDLMHARRTFPPASRVGAEPAQTKTEPKS